MSPKYVYTHFASLESQYLIKNTFHSQNWAIRYYIYFGIYIFWTPGVYPSVKCFAILHAGCALNFHELSPVMSMQMGSQITVDFCHSALYPAPQFPYLPNGATRTYSSTRLARVITYKHPASCFSQLLQHCFSFSWGLMEIATGDRLRVSAWPPLFPFQCHLPCIPKHVRT